MEQNKLGKNKIKYMTINVYKPASYIEGPDTLKHIGIEITTQGTKQIDEAYLVHSFTQECERTSNITRLKIYLTQNT